MPSSPLYLDYAATTPVDPRVARAMQPYFGSGTDATAGTGNTKFGNPGSLHSFGQSTMAAVDASRASIAAAIGAQFREVIFTGSASEANNLALRGAIKKARRHFARDVRLNIITTAIEHESILETVKDLQDENIEVRFVPLAKFSGELDLDAFEKLLDQYTVIVSVMLANNEAGIIQPLEKIAAIIEKFKQQRGQPQRNQHQHQHQQHQSEPREQASPETFDVYPLLHTDAVQALQFLDCNVATLDVDLMTLSAHKIYGPKGVGVLYRREQNLEKKLWEPLSPITTGGGQEYGLRSGTQNVPLIVGFAKAVELIGTTQAAKTRETMRLGKLRDQLWQGIQSIEPRAQLNGVSEVATPHTKKMPSKTKQKCLPTNILPNILNVHFPGVSSQDLLVRFDLAGLAVSAGSACTARSLQPSYVLAALGYPPQRAKESIRFSLGRPTTSQDVTRALRIIKKEIAGSFRTPRV